MQVSQETEYKTMFRVMDDEGRIIGKKEPQLSKSKLEKMYSHMVTSRLADEKSLKLQRQGRLGTFAQSLGHEACQVGPAFALEKNDWFFPYFRDLGAYITLGLPLELYFIYWMGNEIGMSIPPELNIFPIAVPVASQLPHAVGAAMASKIKGDKCVFLVTFGDGATSEGDFHEALNFAGVFKTPTVFICFNNQYAISLPREKQTASETLAEKAEAYGFSGRLVDGNDVLAMYASTKKAMEIARKGGGPSMIEAFTYRLSNHTTSDDATKYRSKEETEVWEKRDPILRFKKYLQNKRIWSEQFEERIKRKADKKIEEAIIQAEAFPPPKVEDLFKYTYKEMPSHLKEQMDELRIFLKENKK